MYILSSYKLIQDAFLWIFPQKTNPNSAIVITTNTQSYRHVPQSRHLADVIHSVDNVNLLIPWLYRPNFVPFQMPIIVGDPYPHQIHGFFGLLESTAKTAFRSVHPFWHSSRLWPTHTQTDRHRPRYVCSNRPHLCTQCMWCGLKITITGLLFAGVAR